MTLSERVGELDAIARAVVGTVSEQHHDGWAMAGDALAFVQRLVEVVRPRSVIEFGSGRSTCALARGARRHDPVPNLVSVDHDPDCAARTAQWLGEDGLSDVVDLRTAPLVLRRHIPDARLLPVYRLSGDLERADVVVVDGPPEVMGGREGALRQALGLCAADGVIVIDDADRASERQLVEQIVSEWEPHVYVHRPAGFDRGLALMFVGRPISSAVRADL